MDADDQAIVPIVHTPSVHINPNIASSTRSELIQPILPQMNTVRLEIYDKDADTSTFVDLPVFVEAYQPVEDDSQHIVVDIATNN